MPLPTDHERYNAGNTTGPRLERRNWWQGEIKLEQRAAGDTTSDPVIGGYAALFNRESVDLGGFVERVAPGAFAKSVASGDIRAFWNHNTDNLLGRTKSGTLTLSEDATGLLFRLPLPDTTAGRDVAALVKRGDISGMSFGFITRLDNWAKVAGTWLRTLLEVDLIEVSPVVFPAYTATDVTMRAIPGMSTEEALVRLRAAEAQDEARGRRLRLLEKTI